MIWRHTLPVEEAAHFCNKTGDCAIEQLIKSPCDSVVPQLMPNGFLPAVACVNRARPM